VAITRGPAGGLSRLTVEIDVPTRRLHEVATAVAGTVAEAAHRVGRTVGCVGIVAGAEPILAALAPVRDVVAARVLAVLQRGESHRRPELWLTLAPGRYLAQVVDPFAPFRADDAAVVPLIVAGAAGHALLAEVAEDAVSVTLRLTLYSRRADLRKLFTLARSALGELPGWTARR
jgi:hypothetical protein